MMNSSPVVWSELYVVAGLIFGAGTAVAAVVAWLWRILNAMQRELTEFRVEVAKTYTTTTALFEMERRFTEALKQLATQFDNGFDRVIEVMGQPVRRRSK